MKPESKAFLHELLMTPSPTGYEEKIQSVVRKHMKKYADYMETDLHGNLIVGINTKASRRVMLAGHCDQIGFMVKHITKDGFIYLVPLGGIDAGVCPGAHITIYNEKGSVEGIFGRKPIHEQSGDERGKLQIDLAKFPVDIGARSEKEALKRVQIGDFATFRLGVTELSSDLFCSPGVDDKVGLFIAMEALKLCAGTKLDVALYAVSTVQEEVGLRGARTAAYSIDPEVGIAIDVTHASDSPVSDSARPVPCKLGAGPGICRGPNINPIVERLLVQSAKKAKIPYQLLPSGGLLGNDANAIQVTKGGVATGSIGVPNRYMHTQVEVSSYKDLEGCSRLLAAFVKEIKKSTDFRPGHG